MNAYKHINFEDMPGGVLFDSMTDDEQDAILKRINREKYARASKYRISFDRAAKRRRNRESTTALTWLDDLKDIAAKQALILA